jgi:hypothetical protein
MKDDINAIPFYVYVLIGITIIVGVVIFLNALTLLISAHKKNCKYNNACNDNYNTSDSQPEQPKVNFIEVIKPLPKETNRYTCYNNSQARYCDFIKLLVCHVKRIIRRLATKCKQNPLILS